MNRLAHECSSRVICNSQVPANGRVGETVWYARPIETLFRKRDRTVHEHNVNGLHRNGAGCQQPEQEKSTH